MSKAQKPSKAEKPVVEEAPAPAPAPVVQAADGPVAMVMPTPAVPAPRIRGVGPRCRTCGSGMIQNGSERTNHPFKVRIYWKCKNPGCKATARTEERKR
ncbi:MAG TPA: hypothetical protein VM219_08270 [Phycisphaerae bacterium]|nr:hypothetical protein [Phycisphaerae bacterium]HUX00344.1 hypothetical protein [Phycisphaerae bacterium]